MFGHVYLFFGKVMGGEGLEKEEKKIVLSEMSSQYSC